jgi:surface protein
MLGWINILFQIDFQSFMRKPTIILQFLFLSCTCRLWVVANMPLCSCRFVAMFYMATNFNGDPSSWNTASVTKMQSTQQLDLYSPMLCMLFPQTAVN